MTTSPVARTERARIAALSRSRDATDPELVEARRNLRAEMLAESIRKTLATAPPLTDDQHRRLAGLFAGGASK